MKDQNLINENELYLVDGSEIDKYTFTATAGQNTFTIPFEFDGSSSLTLYYNGVMMKEDDNYTIADKVITLVDWTAEEGDYLTVMGIQGAAAIDFAKDADKYMAQMENKATEVKADLTSTATTAKNDITSTVSSSKTEINNIITTGKNDLNSLIDTLPDNWDSVMDKNSANTMGANGKITMDNSYVPSGDNDIITKKYVNNYIEENSYQVGDTLTTARTNLGDDWLLCNGTFIDNSVEVYNLLPKEDYLTLSSNKYYDTIQDQSNKATKLIVRDGYYFRNNGSYSTNWKGPFVSFNNNNSYYKYQVKFYDIIKNNNYWYFSNFSNSSSSSDASTSTGKFVITKSNSYTMDNGQHYIVNTWGRLYNFDNKIYFVPKIKTSSQDAFDETNGLLVQEKSTYSTSVSTLIDNELYTLTSSDIDLTSQIFQLRDKFYFVSFAADSTNSSHTLLKLNNITNLNPFTYSTVKERVVELNKGNFGSNQSLIQFSYNRLKNKYYIFIGGFLNGTYCHYYFYSNDNINWNFKVVNNNTSELKGLIGNSYNTQGQGFGPIFSESYNLAYFGFKTAIYDLDNEKIIFLGDDQNYFPLSDHNLHHLQVPEGIIIENYFFPRYRRYLPTYSTADDSLYTYIKAK